MCNDNLSGIALTTYLAKILSEKQLHYTYRFLFIPSTIGSITWLALNQAQAKKIRHGLVVACVGDSGFMHYKRSRQGNAEIDRAAAHVLEHAGQPFEITDFAPYGYDERQYSSPGFKLNMGVLSRTPHGQFPEYHTSADNLDFVRPEYLADSLKKYVQILDVLDNDHIYLSTNPNCEPQLGKRGLYHKIGGHTSVQDIVMTVLWILNFSDGDHSLLDIAEKARLPFSKVLEGVKQLVELGLLVRQ